MSLKYFHVFFITISVLFLFFFGFWSMESYAAGESIYLLSAVISFIAAFALIFYGRRFWNNLKAVGFFSATLMVVLCNGGLSWACSTCYADPSHPIARGLTWAVLVMLGFIVMVLSGFIALIINYNRRSAHLSKKV